MRWIFCSVIACLVLGSPATLADSLPPFVGHWIGAYRGQPIELLLEADGTGRYQDQSLKWQFRYGQLRLDRDGEIDVYAMKADQETLMIAGGPLATLLMLHRVSGEWQSTSVSHPD